jgi:hypothetical protein
MTGPQGVRGHRLPDVRSYKIGEHALVGGPGPSDRTRDQFDPWVSLPTFTVIARAATWNGFRNSAAVVGPLDACSPKIPATVHVSGRSFAPELPPLSHILLTFCVSPSIAVGRRVYHVVSRSNLRRLRS